MFSRVCPRSRPIFGLATRVGPSRLASACSFSILKLNMVLTCGIPTDFHGGVHFFMLPYAIESVPSLSGNTFAYRWRSLPKIRRQRAGQPQGGSSNGCCVCITMYQSMCASFSRTHYWYEVGMLNVSEANTGIYLNERVVCKAQSKMKCPCILIRGILFIWVDVNS